MSDYVKNFLRFVFLRYIESKDEERRENRGKNAKEGLESQLRKLEERKKELEKEADNFTDYIKKEEDLLQKIEEKGFNTDLLEEIYWKRLMGSDLLEVIYWK